MRLRFSLVATALLASLSLPAQAELILSGIPAIQERTELDKNFIKLAAQLTDILGEPVRYVAPINEMLYGQQVRKGAYDILIDNPVLAAWRINKGMHKPVAVINAPSTYLVIVPATDSSTKSPEQLIGKAVCVQSSPSVANLMFMNLYPNPIQTPNLRIVDAHKTIAEKVLDGSCRAGVVSVAFFENVLEQNAQKQLRVIYNTRPLLGNAMTVSSKVSEEKRKALSKRITSAEALNDPMVQSINAVSSALGGNAAKTNWLEAKPESFKGLEQLLIQQSYGWD